jgi:RNA recognition motif-containing protein
MYPIITQAKLKRREDLSYNKFNYTIYLMEEKKNSVYLTGIPYTCVEEDIIEFFKSCGAPTYTF